MLRLLIVTIVVFTLCSHSATADEPKEKSAKTDTSNVKLGVGLPRDLDKIAPVQENYPVWKSGGNQAIDSDRLKRIVADLSAIALEDKKVNKYWGRLPGTEADKKSMAYIASDLKQLGFKLTHKKAVIPQEWKPQDWGLSYSTNDQTYQVATAFPSGSGQRSSSSLTAEVIWLGLGAEADFKGRDVKGKVAVIYSMFVPGGRSHSASNRSKLFYANKRAAESGASLIVNIMGVPGNAQFMPAPHYFTRGKVIAPTEIPVVTMSQDEGLALQERLAAGDVVMTYDIQWQEQTNLEASYLIAELTGKSAEEIFIAAHTDGYFQGALDNASGVAVTLEMARHYATQKGAPERTIKLFFFSDHHHGEFTRREFEESYDWSKVALVITVEHPSQTQLYWYNNGLMTSNAIGAFRWNVSGSETLKGLVQDNLRNNGISTYTLMDKNPKFTRQAPGFHIIDHVIYHTTLDTPELVPIEGLKRATKAFLSIVEQINKLPLSEIR